MRENIEPYRFNSPLAYALFIEAESQLRKGDEVANQNWMEKYLNLLSVKEAYQRIGLGKTAFYGFLGAGEIPAVKIGKRTLIDEEALNDFVRRQVGYRAKKKKPS